MTNQPLSSQDLEIFSAYLDDELSVREAKRLETRLAESEGLRATLEDLKRTRLMLRSLPKVRAPRNFTLSPKMVGELRRPQRSFWQLSSSWAMVSAISVMILMITLMGDLMGVFTPAPLLAAGYSAEAMSLTTEMESLAETNPEDAPVAMVSPLETPVPDGQAVAETFAVPEADPLAPEATDSVGAEAMRAIEEPATKEAASLDNSTESADAALTEESPEILFTPLWVRVMEGVLLAAAVIGISLALIWQRKA